VEELVEMGLLEAKGSKKGRVYHLSAWVFKQLGRPTAYVHRRGIEGVRQEELVMQMAYKYRKVTRGDVLQLFPNLTGRQASHLLQKLVQSGRLRPKGSKRGRYYEPAK